MGENGGEARRDQCAEGEDVGRQSDLEKSREKGKILDAARTY